MKKILAAFLLSLGIAHGANQEYIAGTDSLKTGMNKINRNFSNVLESVLSPTNIVSLREFGGVGDGATDDSAAFRTALLYATNGATIIIDGVFGITNVAVDIINKTNLTIQGIGEGSGFISLDDVTTGYQSGAVIAQLCDNLVINNIQFDGAGNDVIGIVYSNCVNSTISKCEIFDTGGLAAVFDVRGLDNTYDRNHIHDTVSNGESCRGLYIGNVNTGHESIGAMISHNLIQDTAATGIGGTLQDGDIVGNRVFNTAGSGIAMGSSENSVYRDVNIVGNKLMGNAFQGIQWDQVDDQIISGIGITGNTIWSNDGSGIYIYGSEHTTIVGNEIFDNNTDATGTDRGIALFGYNKHTKIIGNDIYDTRSTPFQYHGLYVLSDDYTANANVLGTNVEGLIVMGNSFINNSNANIFLDPNEHWLTNIVISGNVLDGKGTTLEGLYFTGSNRISGKVTENYILNHATRDAGSGNSTKSIATNLFGFLNTYGSLAGQFGKIYGDGSDLSYILPISGGTLTNTTTIAPDHGTSSVAETNMLLVVGDTRVSWPTLNNQYGIQLQVGQTANAGGAVRLAGVAESVTGGSRKAGLAFWTDDQTVAGSDVDLRETMRLSAGGNLGIATNAPQAALHIRGDGSSTPMWFSNVPTNAPGSTNGSRWLQVTLDDGNTYYIQAIR